MRQLIQKLGRLNTVIIITVFSVIFSILLTNLVFYLRKGYLDFNTLYYEAIIVPLFIAPLASWSLVGQLIKIDSLERKMRQLATYDSLTGLLSRQAFFHTTENFIHYAKRDRISLSVIALDLDKFKKINDNYGHNAGDQVLKNFATLIKKTIRNGDFVGRIGGEEFSIFLPNTKEDTAYIFSERLHNAIRESIINYDDTSIKYTVSMGIVSLIPQKADNIESILKKADQSLYLAKRKGRDCTVIFKKPIDIEK